MDSLLTTPAAPDPALDGVRTDSHAKGPTAITTKINPDTGPLAGERKKSGGYVLIVDDDKDICELLSFLMRTAGYETRYHHDGSSAIASLEEKEPDILLLDTIIPEPNGMLVLAHAHRLYPQLPVIIISGNAGILSAACAIKAGAWDYIPKPFDNSKVLSLVHRAMHTRWKHQDSEEAEKSGIRSRLATLMGPSKKIHYLANDLIRVARTEFSVIIHGETGTGKELVARTLHEASLRSAGPLVPLDCGAVPDTLIENELFGHERGSYTSADRSQPGKFEAAKGGTLFLDEIANMSSSAQSKLLRALQERVIYRIGGSKPIPTDIRVIVASNENLFDAVVKGKFREDLYYRLNEYVIHIPPLRDRPEDVLSLAERFLSETNQELRRLGLDFSTEGKDALLRYRWPGNVRELRAVVRRAALVADEAIGPRELGLNLAPPAGPELPRRDPPAASKNPCLTCTQPHLLKEGDSLKDILQRNIDAIERTVIFEALEKAGNNKAEAARALKVDYKTLHTKLKKFSSTEEK